MTKNCPLEVNVADPIALELAPGARVIWDLDAVRRMAPAGASEPESLWTLEGELEDFELLRVLSAAFEDGRAVLFAAARPEGAAGHGEEVTAAAVVGKRGPQEVSEPLVSTEYAADGSPRRVTLELWLEDEDYPLRGAGEATAVATQTDDEGVERAGAALRMRLDGKNGAGAYEIARNL